MASELIAERRHALWELTQTLVLRNIPSPLSPLWERFVLDFVLPQHHGYPARAAAGKVREVGQEQRAMYQRNCALGPFDFEDAWVNVYRAENFVGWLDAVREELAENGQVRTRWWPTEREEMVKTIMKEHEAIKGGGGGIAAKASSSRSRDRIKEERHDAAPVASGGEQNDLAKVPSNNKRKAEVTSSTNTPTEMPASSTENSGIRIKRERIS